MSISSPATNSRIVTASSAANERYENSVRKASSTIHPTRGAVTNPPPARALSTIASDMRAIQPMFVLVPLVLGAPRLLQPPGIDERHHRLELALIDHTPCPLQTSMITPERWPKFCRFIVFLQTGHCTYRTAAPTVRTLPPAFVPTIAANSPRPSRLVQSSVKASATSHVPAHDGHS